MAGILTLPSTGVAAPAPAESSFAKRPPPASQLPVPAPVADTPQQAGDVLNFKGTEATAAPLHANGTVADALAQAVAAGARDAPNTILGPAFYRGMSSVPPVSYYQPRQVAQVRRTRE